MSNSASWGIDAHLDRRADEPRHAPRQHEPARARADRDASPPVKVLFVYNCNPAATSPDQRRILQRPRARGSLHRRLRAGDDRHGALRRRRAARARRSSRATTSRRATGPSACGLGRPVIEPVGEARSNADVFGELLRRLDLAARRIEPRGELDEMLHVLDSLPADRRDRAGARRAAPPFGGRPDPVRRRVPEDAGPEGRSLSRSARRRGARWVSTAISRIRRPTTFRWR